MLAAGKSERMGKNKLLLKLGGKRLIDCILDALEASKVDEIIVVLGYKSWEIAEILKPRLKRIRILVNKKYEEGMVSSFKTGLKQIENADAALLVLGDQLISDPKFINVMIEQMEKSRNKALIISPIFKGKKGHPVLFSKELFDEILDLEENKVIRDIINKHGKLLLTIEGTKWTVTDIDTPKDFVDAIQCIEENAL